jgi:oligopeptide/dipeptide ABC transporter ATP-binding protein
MMLQVKNLSVSVREVPIVEGVTFDIEEGETVGLVGESGCGKSTVALALIGLLQRGAQVTGSIKLDGEELLGQPESHLRKIRGAKIGMVFQDALTSLNPTTRVGRQISESIRLHQGVGIFEGKRRALAILYKVGIRHPDRTYRQFPHELSGGMRQRVMIALALACRPKLLIADEPTTALDVTIQAQILSLLRELQQEFEMSILLITHDLGVVAGMCRRVGVMYAGQLVELGTARQIYHTPKHPYTRGLLGCVPTIEYEKVPQLHPIPGSPPKPGSCADSCPFAARCAEALTICTEQPAPVHTFEPGHRARCWQYEEQHGTD